MANETFPQFGALDRKESDPAISAGLSSFTLSIFLHVGLAALLLIWTSVLQYVNTRERKLTWIDMSPTETRVVDSQTGEKTNDPAKDAFLGKQSQRVDRQTTAKLKQLQDVELRIAKRGGGATAPADKSDAAKKAPSLSKLGVPLLSVKAQPKPQISRTPGPFQNEEIFQRPTGEYIQGVKESDVTALNTREYIFFGFFQRIRDRLDLAWSRVLHENLDKMARRGRSLAAEKEHTTRLKVVLNEKGIITQVSVLEESGSFDLDDAAVRAFNQSGPFPNPPKGLVDNRGEVEIQWDFILRT